MGGITVVPSTLFMLLLIYGFAVLGASVELEDLMVAPEVPKNLLEKRASNYCPTGDYTTPIGQVFSTSAGDAGCGRDLPNNDLAVVQQDNITDVTDCMAYCSSIGTGVAYGVTYLFQATPGTCHCKTEGILTADYTSNEYVHSALAVDVNSSLSLSEPCPYPNASIQTATDSSQYEIYCGMDMVLVDDMCPLTSPTASSSTNNLCPTHANSLQDCMNQCTTAHVLCLAVAYAPDMRNGYGNCYFKSNISTPNIDFWNSTGDTRHMAILTGQNVWNVNRTCTNGTIYTSPNGAEFEIACNTNQPPNDLVQYHMQNMSACADACAIYTNSSGLTCAGAVFDSTMEDGYQNCYLKTPIGTSFETDGRHWLQLSKAANVSANVSETTPASDPSTTSAPGQSPPSSSPGKAWIAGPVIGGLAGVTTIAGLLYWLRQRRHSPRPAEYSQAQKRVAYPGNQSLGWQMKNEIRGHDPGQDYLDGLGTAGSAMQQSQRYIAEVDSERQIQESGGVAVAEMPE